MKKFKTLCVGLIVLDEDSQTVQLVHSTLQGYIGRRYPDLLSKAQLTMATACPKYLSLKPFYVIDNRPNKHTALLHYAASHWAPHSKQANVSKKAIQKARDNGLEHLAVNLLAK